MSPIGSGAADIEIRLTERALDVVVQERVRVESLPGEVAREKRRGAVHFAAPEVLDDLSQDRALVRNDLGPERHARVESAVAEHALAEGVDRVDRGLVEIAQRRDEPEACVVAVRRALEQRAASVSSLARGAALECFARLGRGACGCGRAARPSPLR